MAYLSDRPRARLRGRQDRRTPKVLLRQGERYRDGLRRLAAEQGVSDRVVFEDRYLDTPSLRSLIRQRRRGAAAVRLTREQISSGRPGREPIAAGEARGRDRVPACDRTAARSPAASWSRTRIPNPSRRRSGVCSRTTRWPDPCAARPSDEAERLAWPAIGQSTSDWHTECWRSGKRPHDPAGANAPTPAAHDGRHQPVRACDAARCPIERSATAPTTPAAVWRSPFGRTDAAAEALAERWLAFLVQAHDGDGAVPAADGVRPAMDGRPVAPTMPAAERSSASASPPRVAPWPHIGREARRLFELVAPFRSV